MVPTTTAQPRHATLVEEFCNTVDLEGGEEDLRGPDATRSWFADRGLLTTTHDEVTPESVAAVQELRESVRAVLLAHQAGGPATSAELDRLARRHPLRVDATGELPRLVPVASGVEGAMGAVLVALVTAVTDGSWDRLKVCSRHSCRWVFYDTTRNRSRSWCSMSACGNKEKTKAYRERNRRTRG